MIEQGTDEWFAARAGKVTASQIAAVLSKGRGSAPSATRANYMAQLVAERLSGQAQQGFSNATMQWGTETEPQARLAYEFFTGMTVEQVGFVDHPSLEGTGASPDGLVGDKGLVEIKCPNTATHIQTLLGAKIDRKYLLQMHWQMECTRREWCDFVSYDPRMPVEMQLHVQRVECDYDLAREIDTAVIDFVAELDALEVDLRGRYMDSAA